MSEVSVGTVPRPTGPRVLLFGMLAQEPYAGIAVQGMQYLVGLARLGFDVHYVEDTGRWPYDADEETVTEDPGYALRYLGGLMGRIGMQDRWIYRSGVDDSLHNISAERFRQFVERADVIINLTGATELREEYLAVPVRIYLETDPVLPQIEIAQGRDYTIGFLAAHTHHFTYGENIGAPDCGVPISRFHYRPTRPPVILEWWRSGDVSAAPGLPSPAARFTTVANWEQTGKDIEWKGETYGWSKHTEFLKFIDLPRRTRRPLELALAGGDAEALHRLIAHGWWLGNGMLLSREVAPYRQYIMHSLGEFTVAKDQNIRLRSGWFSDRSACYLASGRPVVAQDTGFDVALPVGEGLIAYATGAQAAAALDAVAADYERHRRAARALAEEHLDSDRVLSRLLEAVL
jgi:hypothetical protein